MADQRGLIQPGNIDLNNRPVVQNPDGSYSTVRSVSFNIDGHEVLVPTVTPDGRVVSDREALALYQRTGQHLGIFDNAQDANAYAQSLHTQQAQQYSNPGGNMAKKNDPQAFTGFGASQSGGMPGAAMGEPGTQGAGQISTPTKVSGSGGSKGVGAGKSYDPDNMINTYLPGLTPEQHAAVRDALRGAESGSGVDYHKAIDALSGQHPELQQYTKWGKAFPPSSPGQLTAPQMQALLGVADKYEQPYIDAMKNTSGQMGAYLKQLMPSLPKGYQSLVHAQMEGPGGLLNLPNQVSNLIHEENPAAIANAYAQAYGGGTGATQQTSSNLFNSLLGSAPKTG